MSIAITNTVKHLMENYISRPSHYMCTIEYKEERFTFGSCCHDGLLEILAQIMLLHNYKHSVKVINFVDSGGTWSTENISIIPDILDNHLEVCCPDKSHFIVGYILTWLDRVESVKYRESIADKK